MSEGDIADALYLLRFVAIAASIPWWRALGLL